MRVVILHAAGDGALAEQVARELAPGEAITAALSSNLAFGGQIVVIVLWTAQSQAQAHDLEQVVRSHRATLIWHADGAPPPAAVSGAVLLGPDSDARSIAAAIRLVEIDSARPREAERNPRRDRRGVVAVALSLGAVVALGAAGAAAVMFEGAAPFNVLASAPSQPKAAAAPLLSDGLPPTSSNAPEPAPEPAAAPSGSADGGQLHP